MILKINSDDDLPLEKSLHMYNVVTFINSVFNKNQNLYDYQVFSEKCSYK